jgi:hypothetical protein
VAQEGPTKPGIFPDPARRGADLGDSRLDVHDA